MYQDASTEMRSNTYKHTFTHKHWNTTSAFIAVQSLQRKSPKQNTTQEAKMPMKKGTTESE